VIGDGKVGQKRLDFQHPESIGMPYAMKPDIAFDPVDVGFFGAVSQVTHPCHVSTLVQEFHGQLILVGLWRWKSALYRRSGFLQQLPHQTAICAQ
jgi:hypothetical protein